MSWLFSQALVVEYLEDTCSDGAPFAPLNGNPTPQAYLPHDRMTVFSRPSRFGMTFAHLTDGPGLELLTWYLAASRARTSAQPEKAQGSTASAAACGVKWHELSVRYDRASSSWRTHRSLWDEDLSACSLTLPKWGLMRDGVLSERMTLVLHTAENDAGLWPTPNVPNGGRSCSHVTDWRGRTAYHNGKKVQVGLEHAARYWPTPTANEMRTTNREALIARRERCKETAKNGNGFGLTLGNAMTMAGETGGALNPPWVEWLMGWPLGWTDLKPLETARCRNAQPRHGGF